MEWNDLTLVLAVCRAGTLSGAARSLGLNHSTVFRRLNTIEEKMGVRFFERLPGGYVMTEAGEAAMRVAERVDEEVLGLSRHLLGRDLRLQGTIRVTAPEGLSSLLLNPLLISFCKTHPDIHIDLVVTSSTLQLSRREADLAVRATTKPPDTSLGRRICSFRFCMYASQSYLKKHPDAALEDYDWLMPDDGIDFLPPAIWKKEHRSRAKVVMSSNKTMCLIEAAKKGLGVVPLPCFWGDSEKQLIRVTDPPEELTLDLWILTHPDLRHTARVRTLMRFLYDSLEQQKGLIEGTSQFEKRGRSD